ncbi:MAG: helix-turn-helix transcriptional regulator [Clostridia bacterium]|nr:helix-turn-helix transcriptional regulator [Clostridia bacterium]
MITAQEISKKISEAIKFSGKTQTEIAKSLGVSQQMISYYFKGEKLPTAETLANLCAVLDLDANDILCLNKVK